MSVVERDMWDHYHTGNERYRAAVKHRAIGWEHSGLIRKGSAVGKQQSKPDMSRFTFPSTQGERGATLMTFMSEIGAKMGAVKEYNQAQPKRTRATPVPLLSAGTNQSPSKSIARKWVREAKIDDEESDSESNSEVEDGEPDWTQVNASKGYGSAAYFVRRDHRRTKAVREQEKVELAKLKANKIAERAERAIAAEKAYDEHNLKFPTRPTTGTVMRRLAYEAKVEHVKDVAVTDEDWEGFTIKTTFARSFKSSEFVAFSDCVIKEDTPLLGRLCTLKSKTKSNIEYKDSKTPKLQLIVVPAISHEPTTYTAQTITVVSGSSLSTASICLSAASQGLTAHTAQALNNTPPSNASTYSDRKGKRNATPAEDQLIESERSLYGWYAPPYLPQERVRA